VAHVQIDVERFLSAATDGLALVGIPRRRGQGQADLETDPWEERSHLGVVTMMEKAGRHGEARRLFQTYTSRMEEPGVTAAPFPTSGPV
jgi:hypothetical protein